MEKRAFYPKKTSILKWIAELEMCKEIYERTGQDFSARQQDLNEYKEMLKEYEENGIEF